MSDQLDNVTILEAMRAEHIPAEWSGLWFIEKADVKEPKLTDRHGEQALLPAGIYTYLFRITESRLHLWPPGEVVMEDTPFELRTHLNFIRRAYGRVLVTGLGLGCVVRGLLINPRVEYVTVIENSPDVMRLVAPYMPEDRLTLIEDDAFRWTIHNKRPFDCAWHDLWTNKDAGEPKLDFWHTRLLMECKRFAEWQGAWSFDRTIRKSMERRGFQWMG